MQKILGIVLLLVFNSVLGQNTANSDQKFVLVIHGGSGYYPEKSDVARKRKSLPGWLKQALQEGHRILAAGGSSLNAVEAVVKILENNPLFNAGKGAVFTSEGKNEMDAAIHGWQNPWGWFCGKRYYY
jgi:beta-aspartyl-peptidase (threonine type)